MDLTAHIAFRAAAVLYLMPLELLEGALLADQLARSRPVTGYRGVVLALATLGADLQLVESDL